MQIIQKVTVKQILTENSKTTLLQSFEQAKRNLIKECEQFKFEIKKFEKNNKYRQKDISSFFEKEIDLRKEKIKLLDFQIKQLDILPLGSELKENEVNALVEVDIGYNWEQFTKEKSIIIKEGIVVDIR